MPRFKSKIVYLSLLYWGLVGCTTTIEIVPELEEGNIAGYVKCLDEFGNLLNPENVEIFVNGAPEFFSTSDTLGFYQIASPIGYQHITFQKEGLGSFHLHNQLIIGGEIPIVFNSAKLYKPVDVEALIDSSGISNDQKAIYVSGKATSATPFDLVLAYYTDEFPTPIKYLWLDTYDESEFSIYTANFNATILLLNFTESTQSIYAAIYCQNAYDYIKEEGGTLKQVTEFVELSLNE